MTIKTDLKAYGKMSRALFERCGEQLPTDLRDSALPRGHTHISLGKALSVPARPQYGLRSAEYIIFVAMWADESPYTRNLGDSCYAAAFREAFSLGLTSLAIPIFAMGGGTADTFPVERILFTSLNTGYVDRLRLALQRFL